MLYLVSKHLRFFDLCLARIPSYSMTFYASFIRCSRWRIVFFRPLIWRLILSLKSIRDFLNTPLQYLVGQIFPTGKWKVSILKWPISSGLVKLSNILSFFFLVAVSLVLTLIARLSLSPFGLYSECILDFFLSFWFNWCFGSSVFGFTRFTAGLRPPPVAVFFDVMFVWLFRKRSFDNSKSACWSCCCILSSSWESLSYSLSGWLTMRSFFIDSAAGLFLGPWVVSLGDGIFILFRQFFFIVESVYSATFPQWMSEQLLGFLISYFLHIVPPVVSIVESVYNAIFLQWLSG